MTLVEATHICSPEYLKEFFESLEGSYPDVVETLGEEGASRGYSRVVDGLIDGYMECLREKHISKRDFKRILGEVGDFIRKHQTAATERSGTTLESAKQDEQQAAWGRNSDQYKLDCLLFPKDIDTLPTLSYRQSCFIAPQTVDLRDYCTATQDQGNRPWCAAFAAVGFASNVLWRKTDLPTMFDPERHYRYAKQVDGSPKTDGTTLVAVLQSLLNDKIFLPAHSEVKVLRTVEQVKYAIHKYGCCLVGVMVSKEWYSCNSRKSTISGKKDASSLGGHAVLACGYTRDGIIIQNSWGINWGEYGFALITWKEFEREFMYGAVLDNCLYDTKMN